MGWPPGELCKAHPRAYRLKLSQAKHTCKPHSPRQGAPHRGVRMAPRIHGRAGEACNSLTWPMGLKKIALPVQKEPQKGRRLGPPPLPSGCPSANGLPPQAPIKRQQVAFALLGKMYALLAAPSLTSSLQNCLLLPFTGAVEPLPHLPALLTSSPFLPWHIPPRVPDDL